MQQQQGNSLKALRILHKAMMLGMLMLVVAGVFVVVMQGGVAKSSSLDKPLQVVALVLAIGGTAAGFTLFKKRLQTIQPTDTATSRLEVYRAAAIIRWALIEMPILFAAVSFLLTGNYAFLALALALLFVFGAVRPSTQVIMFQLQLTEAEVSELEGTSK